MKWTSTLPQLYPESNCCGASVLGEVDGEGICSSCKEHCVTEERQRIEDEHNDYYEGFKENT